MAANPYYEDRTCGTTGVYATNVSMCNDISLSTDTDHTPGSNIELWTLTCVDGFEDRVEKMCKRLSRKQTRLFRRKVKKILPQIGKKIPYRPCTAMSDKQKDKEKKKAQLQKL